MRHFSYFALLCTLSVLLSCKGAGEKPSNANAAATDLCHCMQPLVDVNKKMQELAAAGKMEEMTAMFHTSDSLSQLQNECIHAVMQQYKVKLEDQSLREAMKEVCPQTSDMMNR